MVRDNYYVIAYRILTYLYGCFRTGDRPEIGMYNANAMGISPGYWSNMMESLNNEGFITGISMIPMIGHAPGIEIGDIKITKAGIDFLEDNSKIAKAKEFLKAAKDIIPGI